MSYKIKFCPFSSFTLIYPKYRFIKYLAKGENILWLVQSTNKNYFVLKTPSKCANRKIQNRLYTEQWFLYRLKILPHVIPIECYCSNGLSDQVIVLKYIPKGSLKNALKNQVEFSSIKSRVQSIYFVALALQEIHKKGILHLDIKPSNILVDTNFSIYLSDFGFASFFEMDQIEKITNKKIKNVLLNRLHSISGGTYEYMAPERFLLPVEKLTPSVDIYSLGILLVELLTNNTLIKSFSQDNSRKKEDLLKQHKNILSKISISNYPDLKNFDGAQEIISKALNPNVEYRYQDALRFAEDIKDVFKI